ncbi:mechanosensitive ion channel family protein [Flavobacterium psychroterrae]|jgi:small conductance mechanosensitive channel|uniref:Mechanosensitive ion channel family protein n=1 Tax=Flavobacterium psychroterrae TaxID=2133767 RepID=A0ABS5P6B4_9FLAO|nr:mechanosensitive ion channel domain-containing protein [Flavobacterium psychroterrae]MBS7229418.1 mechanosensitive ion channel family protein [Flavobacterium psychroterrae]
MEEFLRDIFKHVEGYYYGLVDITPKILLAILVVLISWFIASRVKVFTDRRLQTKMHDPLLATFIANLVKAVLIVIGLLFMFRVIGLTGVAQSVLAGAGISAFVIGFALKDIGENFLAGILLAFKRPFSVGDIIESNGVKGKVVALNLRDTQIKSDSKNIYIPNALLIKNTLVNFNSEGYLLQDFTIGLEYGSDYRKAIEIITEVMKTDNAVIDKGYSNSAVVAGITGTTVQVIIRYWVKTDKTVTDGKHRSEVVIKVAEALNENGFVLK